MPLLRRIARPMLASMFVAGGIDTLRDPDPRVKKAEPIVARIADILPDGAPKDVGTLVRIDAAVKVGAGLLLASGRAPRVAAAVLAGSLLPTTVAGHPFWQHEDPAERSSQRIHFLKNVSMLGGLLITAADTEGNPSLGWRARHLRRKASRRAHTASGLAHGAAHSASGLAHGAAHNASGLAHGASRSAAGAAHAASGRAQGAAGTVRGALPVG